MEIISSNINSMLGKTHEPEKIVLLMIQEMEDATVKIDL